MKLVVTGVSHKTAPVEVRERLAIPEDRLPAALDAVKAQNGVAEALILSTCNRVEIAITTDDHADPQAAVEQFLNTAGLDPYLYRHEGKDAIHHLFRVAASLDSMVVGEPQILSQVRDAFRRSEAEGAASHTLTALFHAAARTGRRVRTETNIGAAPDAFVEAGADLAQATLGRLEGRTAVVVGAGQMSALAVKHLRRRRVGTVRVLTRSLERARALAERTGAALDDLGALPEAVADADLVVSATGASGLVLREDAIRRAMRGRERPLFILDIAVPRDVEPSAGSIPGVRLVDLTGLKRTLDARAAEAALEVDRARGLVAEEVHRFTVRRRSERLAPLIHALRERGDAIVSAELERFGRDLSELTPDEREAVEALARGVVAKLLHEPIVRLKELNAPGTKDVYAKLLAELFDIGFPEP